MKISSLVSISLAGSILAACASLAPVASDRRADQRCDEAVSQAVSFGPGQARAIAESSVRQQEPDVRGYLVGAGVRRVRSAGKSVNCKPYALGYGLTQCVVVARYCGR